MALPDDALSTTALQSDLLSPDNAERENLRADYERGGVALNDPTQGLNVRDWIVTTDGASVWVAPYPEGAPQTLMFTGSGITEVSLAFDRNMQATIAFVEQGQCRLWWYDTLDNAMTTTTYAGAMGPMVSLDDKRDIANATSDIVFAYLRAGNAYFRMQRDRYGVEYLLGPVFSSSGRIVQLGMGTNGRLQFKLKLMPSATHSDLLTDAIYVLSGEQILPMGEGAIDEAAWRSRTYQFDQQPSPGWGRVEGEYPVRVRVFGDGAMVYETPDILDGQPFRLPAHHYREWALEVRGTNRVIAVAVANDRAELL